jgi:hypothetical protein
MPIDIPMRFEDAPLLWTVDDVYSPAAPTRTGVTFTTGMAGTKGIGGEPGMNDGVDGEAKDVREAL